MKDICDTMSKIDGIESLTDSERMAIISHYVHNQDLPLKLPYWAVAQQLIKEKAGMEAETTGRVAAPMVSYSLFPELYRVPFPPPEKYKFTFIDLFAGIVRIPDSSPKIRGQMCVLVRIQHSRPERLSGELWRDSIWRHH